MASLSGKTVMVTGSSSGIGECTAILFASKGYHLTLCGRDSDRLQEAAEKCRQAAASSGHSFQVITVVGDMTDSAVREKALLDTHQAFGRLDVLVVNHGVMCPIKPFSDILEQDYDRVMDINLKSAFFLIQKAVPYLEQSRGCVVCNSSILSELPGQLGIPYNLSKAAMDHMVRCLALELGPKGIRINAVNPTFVVTGVDRDVGMNSEQRQSFFLSICQATPLAGAESSSCAEQAEVIAFLASDDARFITGQCLAVDGGLSCKGNPLLWRQ
ncbi:glucose 1-dehydrogenase [Plakobranchus ocellatus]|uniref:Glucose 1-dehydrogenase n=1 Tax=Plakobranchus ocellatus TaxID=259542 RepID=A0AAV3ZG46_9GAST|nr:glucose 1-dehydrogenase [Plakobranchus ocellatus]